MRKTFCISAAMFLTLFSGSALSQPSYNLQFNLSQPWYNWHFIGTLKKLNAYINMNDIEWFGDYPTLLEFSTFLRKKPKQFKLVDLNAKEIEEFCLHYAIKYPDRNDILSLQARQVAEGMISSIAFFSFLFHVFYRTGIVGLKTETFDKMQWSHKGASTIAANTIDLNTRVEIHPTFWRVLGIGP